MSEKKLQDYIPYYIGCRCLNTWFPEGHEMYNNNWILNSIDITSPKPFRLDNQDDYTWTDSIKPILRKLDTLTVGEAIDLYKITLLNGKGVAYISDEDNFDVSVIKDQNGICSFQVVFIQAQSLHFNINIDGDVLIYNHHLGEDPNITERVNRQHHVTHYLTKAGFDLFGLLKARLAIDSATLPKIN